MTIFGVDYASVDGNKPPDWKAAYAAGVRFTIVRGNYRTWIDPTLARDREAIRDAGIVLGEYMFPVPGPGNPSAAEQVAAFRRATDTLRTVDLPPMIDVEFPHGVAATGLDRDGLLDWIRDAIALLRTAYGVWPLLYTSGRVWDGTDSDSLHAPPTPDLFECPLVLARYPFTTRIQAVMLPSRVDILPWPTPPASWGAGNVWLHQYQGDALGVPGFSATVDLNRFKVPKLGEEGERIAWIRRRLGRPDSGALTKYDAVDVAFVQAFQKKLGLVSDGVVGPKTFAALAWTNH
jgi:peptidoglycan hydrolase-like protein with peptidoglycan-binding domain